MNKDLCGHCGKLWEECKGACIEAVRKHQPYKVVVFDSMTSMALELLKQNDPFYVPLKKKR